MMNILVIALILKVHLLHFIDIIHALRFRTQYGVPNFRYSRH